VAREAPRGRVRLAGTKLRALGRGAAEPTSGIEAPAELDVVEEIGRLSLAGSEGDASTQDARRIDDALAKLDDAWPRYDFTVALLSYEACVALDPRLPRHRSDPRLGPDVLVWGCAPAGPEPRGPAATVRGPAPPTVRPGLDARLKHLARVEAAKALLRDGVIYQANLAHGLVVDPVDRSAARAFFASRVDVAGRSPPCAALLEIPDYGDVVSLSPERFLVGTLPDGSGRDDAAGVVRTFPIKGTRPRGATPTADAAQLAELCASEKDRAEHVMIVDLLRNDLGKVAIDGGVTVERLLDVVSVPNVHHLETTIAARLRSGVRLSDLLRATVPGGSITGAPKSSAVESIHALEDGPRGLYTGVLLVIDRAGRFASSLLIRTWLRPEGPGEPGALHVGGGIVVDSDAGQEWQETLDKAAALSEVRGPEVQPRGSVDTAADSL
jgi:para-aminobenzoate synthetase component 1